MARDPRLLEFARLMRHEPSPAEKRMWRRLLRHRRLAGFRLRRQQPIPPYIADFYCSAVLLVIELDGDSHVDVEAIRYDAVRTAFFESQGLKVLRFGNTQVYEEEEWVLEMIAEAVWERTRKGE